MSIREIIEKKRDGGELSREEIESLIFGYVEGRIPDYQASALLMAICIQGMGFRETLDLTQIMISSGERVDLSHIKAPKIDKHSTGGVGDKVSLVLAPLAASCGIVVPMVSGRALGHTGGTLDKLEAIPGFRTDLSLDQFRRNLETIGVAIIAQTPKLVPADRKLYALRDVTGTVASIPLIAASIMSKKVAEGIDFLVLDVKVGRGAFVKRIEEARELADLMIRIGKGMGVTTVALLTSAEQPLGRAVGNSLEVKETLAVLKGEEAPEDLLEVILALGSRMLVMGGRADDRPQARTVLEGAIRSGAALSKLRQLIEQQGGDPSVIEDAATLPKAAFQVEVKSPGGGNISAIDALEIGLTANSLGASRETLQDTINHAAGIVLDKKVGDEVCEGERIALVHANDLAKGQEARDRVAKAFTLENEKVRPPGMVLETRGER